MLTEGQRQVKWRADRLTMEAVDGLPCFAAALSGYGNREGVSDVTIASRRLRRALLLSALGWDPWLFVFAGPAGSRHC